MASKKGSVPDAWDDDWDKVADVRASALHGATHQFRNSVGVQKKLTGIFEQQEPSKPDEEPEAKLSRAQRKLKHQEANKQLWESAYVAISVPQMGSFQFKISCTLY
jgi:hypothetical protein